ncbi:unnamed protein product [Arabis nemorensis]|uniref:Tudor domain-containing protein n=1 Tax=Arabis nemorensis TaxID=586526 RepID=A0A565CKE0_9BRAS|nr:unnamed protein product [Arabis nemorensis]
MAGSKKHSSAKAKSASASGKDKVSRDYGESLVGSRIQVWWPMDRKFYKGVIESFGVSNKKHKVLYDDGDVENLNLNKERWAMIEEEDAEAEAEEISVQEESGNESSEATPEPKKAKTNGKPSGRGRRDEAVPKKKEKSKSKAKSGKKAEDSDGERERPKRGVKKAEKSNDDEKQIQKPGTERNGKMGGVGGKMVTAASRISGRFQKKENGAVKETSNSLKTSTKISESNNPTRKRRPASEAVSKDVKKPRTSSRRTRSNSTAYDDEEEMSAADDVQDNLSGGGDVEDNVSGGSDDEHSSDDDSKPIVP